jgi:hypothetical protein
VAAGGNGGTQRSELDATFQALAQSTSGPLAKAGHSAKSHLQQSTALARRLLAAESENTRLNTVVTEMAVERQALQQKCDGLTGLMANAPQPYPFVPSFHW